MAPAKKFDPQDHMMKVQGNADYLETKWRLVWFREQFPNGIIETEPLEWTDQRAVFRATVTAVDENGQVKGRATGTKSCTQKQFPRGHIEKAETGAIGRALACLGFGTQFEPEFDEGELLADSPVQRSRLDPLQHVPNAVDSDGMVTSETGMRLPASAYSVDEHIEMASRVRTPVAREVAPGRAETPNATPDPAWQKANARAHAVIPDHALLHDAAVAKYGVASVKDLTAAQLTQLADIEEGKADAETVAKWQAWKQKRTAAQAELMPGTDAVPNRRTADSFTN